MYRVSFDAMQLNVNSSRQRAKANTNVPTLFREQKCLLNVNINTNVPNKINIQSILIKHRQRLDHSLITNRQKVIMI